MSQNHYSDQAASINVTRDTWGNEIPTDKPMHDNSTAGEGSFNFGGGQYSQDFKGGYGSYGVKVNDLGQNPPVERGATNSQTTGRGKDS